MAKFVEGRAWILGTVFSIAESNNIKIHDLMFVPTRDGQKLLLKLDGRLVCEKFDCHDVLYCAEGTTTTGEVLLNRHKVRKRLQELLRTLPWMERRPSKEDPILEPQAGVSTSGSKYREYL